MLREHHNKELEDIKQTVYWVSWHAVVVERMFKRDKIFNKIFIFQSTTNN